MTGFWTLASSGRVVRLDGVTPPMLDLLLESLPDDAPAVVTYRPTDASSMGTIIKEMLKHLDLVALGLYPARLPGAELIEGESRVAVAAVRTLARRAAAANGYFSPFIDELATRAHLGSTSGSARLPAEVRAEGLASVIARCLGRTHLALVVYLDDTHTKRTEPALVDAREWLAYNAHAAVWLTGEPLTYVDRVPSVSLTLAGELADLAWLTDIADPDAEDIGPIGRSGETYPVLGGRPRHNSNCEKAIEAALANKPWAYGRRWNHKLQPTVLRGPFVVDLYWADERCIVEIDGDDHRKMPKFERDRRRDVDLQLAGFGVLP